MLPISGNDSTVRLDERRKSAPADRHDGLMITGSPKTLRCKDELDSD